MFLVLCVHGTVLLKAILHAVLKHVVQGFLGEVLWSPVYVLLAPGNSQMGTHHAADLVPVLTCQHMHPQILAHRHNLLEESHASLSPLNIHLWTGSNEDDGADIWLEILLLLGKTVKHCVCALVVSNVEHFLNIVVILIIVVISLEGSLDLSDHGRDVVQPNFSE